MTEDRGCGLHCGKVGLKSGNIVTPGQFSSLGVPKVLEGERISMMCEQGGNKPEDTEKLINLTIASK